jgi:3-phenylpropionate/trans-cinnamate dioxygenase ferredoxin reductase subunit
MSARGSESILIVGAGHAGGELATALRMEGCTAPIALLGEEDHLPYQRPPLSKAFLSGHVGVESLYLRPAPTYEKHGIELLFGVRVVALDRGGRHIELSNGRRIPYGKVALTTGGRVRRLPPAITGTADGCGNLHYLRTIQDVRRIQAQFEPGFRLVIIGGGYIGLEVAAVGIKRGLHVTVLEALPRVLARVTAPQLSSFYERVHREAGVDIRTGTTITGFELDSSGDAVSAVVTSAGRVAADLVIVGIGLQPNVELAQAAGLEVSDGIVVDEFTVTSDPDIVAAGDCTNHPNDALGRRVRLESVPNAVEQARTAAAVLAGKPRVYAAVPWFWSDQYDLKLQMVGLSAGYDELVLRGSTAGRAFAAFYLRAGRLIAADAVSRPQDFMIAKRLVAARAVVSPANLADESFPLKSLLESR